jgi:hypothetical protein
MMLGIGVLRAVGLHRHFADEIIGAGVAVGTHLAAIFSAGAGFRLRPIMHVIIRFITPPSKPLPQAGLCASSACPRCAI